MWSQDRKKEEIKVLLKSPVTIFFIVVVLVCVIIILVIVFGQKTQPQIEEGVYYEYDPASQENVAFGPPTGAEMDEGPRYVGFSELVKNGMTPSQYLVFKKAISNYAESNEISLTRVSYLKDSLVLTGSYVFDFTAVLNVDEVYLKVRADSSKGWKNILSMRVTLWKEGDKEVYTFEVTEENICEYMTGCIESDPEA